jgi:allantoinase
MAVSVIRGGTIAADYGVFPGDVVIRGEKIAAILTPGDSVPGADQEIDARGLVLYPGGIDPHCHFEEPGGEHREDWHTATMSAAAGGITTCIEHPLTIPPTTTADRLLHKRGLAEARAVVDFGLYGGMVPESIAHIPAMHEAGAMGFKAFMPPSDPDYPHVDDAQLLEGLRCCASLGALTLVHAENGTLLEAFTARLRADGRTDPLAHAESRPPVVELEAVSRAALLAAAAQARLQIVHLSVPEAAEVIDRHRALGQPISVETCPQYLLMDETDLIRLGPWAKCAPPLRSRSLVEGLWQRVLDGAIDCLVSDHAPYTMQEKAAGEHDIWAAPAGLQIMQSMLPAVLDEAVNRRGMSPERFVRFSATNAARILGLYPRKGTILPGSDADLAIYDPNEEWTITAADLFSKHKWTPLAGRRVRGKVMYTIVRGRTVYANGEIVMPAGYGQFLPGPGAINVRYTCAAHG